MFYGWVLLCIAVSASHPTIYLFCNILIVCNIFNISLPDFCKFSQVFKMFQFNSFSKQIYNVDLNRNATK